MSHNRIEYDDKGRLDEVVTDAGMHLEHLGGKRWFLSGQRADGSSIAIWFKGKIEGVEQRDPPTCKSCGAGIPSGAPTDGPFLKCPACDWSARAVLDEAE